MTKLYFLAFASLLLMPFLNAQNTPTLEAMIGTGTVQAQITATGSLVTAFQIPDAQGDSLVTSIREVSLWAGGVDPANNLLLSIQQADTAKSDFQPGFRNVPNSAGVWKVTKAEIEQHLNDFADNGVVDNPIPSIFSWPGKGNPFSMQYNGFATDNPSQLVAAPFSFFGAAPDLYNPANGYYPTFGTVVNNIQRTPDEILFVPFHTKPASALFPTVSTIPFDCNAVFFTYYCDDADFLDHTVFGYVTLEYTEGERIDSLFLGFNVDGDIGNPDDDYLGYLPGHSLAYFYNADTTQINNTGVFPPIVAFDVTGGLLDEDGHWSGIESAIPLHPSNGIMPHGATFPQLANEYYRYLTGYWRDGRPIQEGGTGYSFTGQPVDFIFTGNPAIAAEWSERSAGNVPGDRQVLISSGPVARESGFVYTDKVLFSLTFVPGEQSLSYQWETLRDNSLHQGDFLYADLWPDPYDSLACFNTVPVYAAPQAAGVIVFPNPVGNQLQIDAGRMEIQELALFDLLGRQIFIEKNYRNGSTAATLETGFLPPGIYFLKGKLKDQGQFIQKILRH